MATASIYGLNTDEYPVEGASDDIVALPWLNDAVKLLIAGVSNTNLNLILLPWLRFIDGIFTLNVFENDIFGLVLSHWMLLELRGGRLTLTKTLVYSTR